MLLIQNCTEKKWIKLELLTPQSFLWRKNLENLLNYKGEKSTFTVIRNTKLLSTAFIYLFPPSEIRIINKIQIKIFNFVMLLKANLLITVTNQHKRDICKLIIIYKLQINYESQSLLFKLVELIRSLNFFPYQEQSRIF